jgi:hypothetical protein
MTQLGLTIENITDFYEKIRVIIEYEREKGMTPVDPKIIDN